MVILKVICEGRFSSLLVLVSRPVEVTRRFNAVKMKSLVQKQSIMAFKSVNPGSWVANKIFLGRIFLAHIKHCFVFDNETTKSIVDVYGRLQ